MLTEKQDPHLAAARRSAWQSTRSSARNHAKIAAGIGASQFASDLSPFPIWDGMHSNSHNVEGAFAHAVVTGEYVLLALWAVDFIHLLTIYPIRRAFRRSR